MALETKLINEWTNELVGQIKRMTNEIKEQTSGMEDEIDEQRNKMEKSWKKLGQQLK